MGRVFRLNDVLFFLNNNIENTYSINIDRIYTFNTYDLLNTIEFYENYIPNLFNVVEYILEND